jgi:hypothetical protein
LAIARTLRSCDYTQREAAKTAEREQRWAAQEVRDAKLRERLESMPDEEISRMLASESFNHLSDRQQKLVHQTLEDIASANEAEVDLNLEQIEGEEYSLPTTEEMAPFTLDVSDDVDDEVEQTDEDEEDFSVGVNTWN